MSVANAVELAFATPYTEGDTIDVHPSKLDSEGRPQQAERIESLPGETEPGELLQVISFALGRSDGEVVFLSLRNSGQKKRSTTFNSRDIIRMARTLTSGDGPTGAALRAHARGMSESVSRDIALIEMARETTLVALGRPRPGPGDQEPGLMETVGHGVALSELRSSVNELAAQLVDVNARTIAIREDLELLAEALGTLRNELREMVTSAMEALKPPRKGA